MVAFVIAVVVIAVVIVAIISNHKSIAGNDSLSKSIKEHNAAINDHEPDMAVDNHKSDPAYDAAKQYWDRMGKHCGDSFYINADFNNIGEWIVGGYYQRPGGPTEFKGFTFSELEKPLTEADRLNGFEWSGQTAMTASTYRSWESGNWTQWNDVSTSLGFNSFFSVPLFKKNGQWFYNFLRLNEGVAIDSFPFPPAVNCNATPQ